MDTNSTLLTVRDAAIACSCSTRTIRRLLSTGELELIALGGGVRIRRADLEQLIARGGGATRSPPRATP